jgi:hypothetical protein
LAASALGAQLAKNAELSFRAVSDPGKFFQDVNKAGGFSKFIEKEYKDVEAKWDAWANSEPLTFPDLTGQGKKQAEEISGDLDSKYNAQVKRSQEALAERQLVEAKTRLRLAAVKDEIQAIEDLQAIEEAGGVKIQRQNLQQIQQYQAGISAAQSRIKEIGADIDALRLSGKDDAENTQLTKLVADQRVAAEEYRLKLVEGAAALKDAGKQLKRDLDSSIIELSAVRSDPNGLNKFLDSQAQSNRAQQDFQALLPLFREAQARFTELTGARAPEFSGSTAGVNQQIREFKASVDREFSARETVSQTQSSLIQTNNELIRTQNYLAEVTGKLVGKDWNVSVNVQGSGASSVIGDVAKAL